jgi:hypothetical protein
VGERDAEITAYRGPGARRLQPCSDADGQPGANCPPSDPDPACGDRNTRATRDRFRAGNGHACRCGCARGAGCTRAGARRARCTRGRGCPESIISNVPCATDDPSSERVQRSERHGTDEDGQGDSDEFKTGNGSNVVMVHNCTDGRLRVRAAIQLNTIPGQIVQPLNEAYAEGSCTSCQTLAVALQIDLYSAERATDIEPQNFAIALNTGCTGCLTVARAVQYVQGVDDPNDVSADISDTVEKFDSQLTAIQSDPNIKLPEAEARLNAVLARFITLGGKLGDQRQESED